MAKQTKIDELLAQVTDRGIKAFLEGFKDVIDLAEPISNGKDVTPAGLPKARTTAQAKGRELAESLLHHLIY